MARSKSGHAQTSTDRSNTWKTRIRENGWKKISLVVPVEYEPEVRLIEQRMRARDWPRGADDPGREP